MPDDPREPYGRIVNDTRRAYGAELAAAEGRERFRIPEWEHRVLSQRELDMRIGAAVAAAERERIAVDPEAPLSDALHTLGQVQRMAESMAMSDRADDRERETEQECGRRILAVIGPQGDEEQALPVTADPAPPEINGQLPLPGTETP